MITGRYTMRLECDFCAARREGHPAAAAAFSGPSASACHAQIRRTDWRLVGVHNRGRKAMCPACSAAVAAEAARKALESRLTPTA